jgi:oligoendopeptidase F
MKKQLLKRSEVKLEHTWNIDHIYPSEAVYLETFETLETLVKTFCKSYDGQLHTPEILNDALNMYQDIQAHIVKLSAYSGLQTSVDSLTEATQLRHGKAMMRFQTLSKSLTFFSNQFNLCSDELLDQAAQLDDENKHYFLDVIKDKKHMLSPEVEKTLVQLSPVLNAPYTLYNRFKLADMSFEDFTVDHQTYPNSFTLFENEYEYEKETLVRRKAYETFYEKLAQYQHGFSSNYATHLQKEKIMSELRGFDSVFDYLLENQKVPKALMDRQIDGIMEKLSLPMRRYTTLLKEIHGLEKMTYADLKIAVDPNFEPNVTIESSKQLLMEGLSVLGPEYQEIIRQAFDDRWIDFPQNQGKSTGGFCSSPYGAPSFILINWNGQMDEVMVLAHEIGHAGHFQYANKYQKIINTRPSMYFIEAPSTTNELLMSNHLIKNAKSQREKTWLQSVRISRTYYHNFVTHLLEAAFQRKVYEKVDRKEPISTQFLNQTKLDVLRAFWGDAVEIPEWAGLTWMRQPHYFMGLYPYTYSAGLTLGTKVASMIEKQVIQPEAWIEVLKAGGTKSPMELAMMVGVDLSTDQALNEVIEDIAHVIDEITLDIQSSKS